MYACGERETHPHALDAAAGSAWFLCVTLECVPPPFTGIGLKLINSRAPRPYPAYLDKREAHFARL